jgi:hypothetical protein
MMSSIEGAEGERFPPHLNTLSNITFCANAFGVNLGCPVLSW